MTLLLLRQCKYPRPKTHPVDALLPSDEFRTIQLHYPPRLYVTDNCGRCLHVADNRRVIESQPPWDSELVEVRHIPIQSVRNSIKYLEAPPKLKSLLMHKMTHSQAVENYAEYTQVVSQFPKRERHRAISTGRRPNPAIAENNRRRTETIRSGLWLQMFRQQDGCCGCCHEPFTAHPHLDHDHRTDKVRSLLCDNCKAALGFAHESIERLQQLLAYLATWK